MIYCSVCGRDISREMKLYDNRVNAYCYDCFQITFPKPERKKRPMSMNRKIKMLYYKGKKPSEIALLLGISAEEVYKAMNERG